MTRQPINRQQLISNKVLKKIIKKYLIQNKKGLIKVYISETLEQKIHEFITKQYGNVFENVLLLQRTKEMCEFSFNENCMAFKYVPEELRTICNVSTINMVS